MLSAHTMAVTATGRSDRVVNTQDIFHAALLPGGIFLVLCLALCWFAGHKATKLPEREPLTSGEGWLAAVALVSLSRCWAASRWVISMRWRPPRWAPLRCWSRAC